MNLLWLSANVTILGWDRPAHLVRSIEYLHLLQPFSLEGLLNVLTQDPYYPPLFHISTVVFYSLFGISANSGSMTNAVYLAVLLVSVYGIGRRLYDTSTGLFAACLISLFPIVFNLSRFAYIDLGMMAIVALSVFLLLKSDGLARRPWAYLFGISLGLGMITKWDFAVFAGVPCLYLLVRSPVVADLRSVLEAPRPQWKRLAASVGAGVVAIGFWLMLPTDAWQAKAANALPLAILYWAVVSAVVYVGSLPSRPFNNFAGSMSLAIGVAGVWYIPNLEFMRRGLYAAYYVGSTTRPTFNLDLTTLPIWTLLRGIVNEHLSAPIVFLLLILVAAWLVRGQRRLRTLSSTVWFLGCWFIIPLVFFASFSNQTSVHMRLTIPLVLPLSIALARGCLSIQRSTLRRSLTSVLLAIAVVQWLVLSLDAFAAVPGHTGVQLPGWGKLDWFAGGEFVQWPSSHETDKGYWVAPSIFQHIIGERDAKASRRTTVGLLVDQPYLNINHAAFLTEIDYPQVEVVDLVRHRKRLPVYPQLFSLDYVLVSDSGIGGADAADQSTVLITSILTQPTTEFEKAFRQAAVFKTPNGDVIHLFRNLTYEPPRSIPPELTPRTAGQAANIDFGNQMLLMSYDADPSTVATGHKLKIDLFWEGLNQMKDDYRITLKLVNAMYQVWGQQQGQPGWDSFRTQEWSKGQVVLDEREIPLLPGTPPGSYQVEVTAYGIHDERDLSPVAGQRALLGPIDIPEQANLSVDDLDIRHPLGFDLGGQLRLLGYNVESGFRPGDNIHLELFWRAMKRPDKDYTVFVHLLGPDGRMLAQKDNPPASGFYPTTAWTTGELIRDQYDLSIPLDVPAGTYHLQVGLYRADTGARLPIAAPNAVTQDNALIVASLQIQAGRTLAR
jgi:4-amino-4-deoxy-L-arabinose transferase-like glycosyltransferase